MQKLSFKSLWLLKAICIAAIVMLSLWLYPKASSVSDLLKQVVPICMLILIVFELLRNLASRLLNHKNKLRIILSSVIILILFSLTFIFLSNQYGKYYRDYVFKYPDTFDSSIPRYLYVRGSLRDSSDVQLYNGNIALILENKYGGELDKMFTLESLKNNRAELSFWFKASLFFFIMVFSLVFDIYVLQKKIYLFSAPKSDTKESEPIAKNTGSNKVHYMSLSDREKIDEHMANNEIEKVMGTLQSIFKGDQNLLDSIKLLESRLDEINNSEIRGTNSQENIGVEKRRIMEALLLLINKNTIQK